MRFSLTFAFLAVSFVTLAAIQPIKVKYDASIDGYNKEWASPLPRFDKKTSFSYDVANDDKNLYLIIRVTDASIQQQLVSNGLEIWINTEGKKKKTTGISYPLPMTTEKKDGDKTAQGQQGQSSQQRDGGEMAGGPGFDGFPGGPDGQKGNVANQGETRPTRFVIQKDLILTGFLIENGQQPARGCPVRTAISLDESACMVYELAIPFNTFYKEQLEADDANAVFSLGFIIKKSDTSTSSSSTGMRQMGGMGGGPMGGGMGGGPGGSMGGPSGMSGGPMGGMTDTSNEEKKCWIKFTLGLR